MTKEEIESKAKANYPEDAILRGAYRLGASQVGSTIIEQIEQCLTDSDDVDDICYAYHRIEGKIKELKGE